MRENENSTGTNAVCPACARSVVRRAHRTRLYWQYDNADGSPHRLTCAHPRSLRQYMTADTEWCFRHAAQARALRRAYV